MRIGFRSPARWLLPLIAAGLPGCGGSADSTVSQKVLVPGVPSPIPSTSPPRGYAYVTSADAQGGPGTVYQFQLLGDDRSVEALSPDSIPTGLNPTAVASEPTGHYVYVVNAGDATISEYSVGAGGQLTVLQTTSISGGVPLPRYTVTVDPSGRFLYVVSELAGSVVPTTAPALIAQYSIGSGGALVPLPTASFTASVAATGPLTIDPGVHYAYLPGDDTQGNPEILQFLIGADASLTPSGVAAQTGATAVGITPGGTTAYLLSSCVDRLCDGQLAPYSIGNDGALTPYSSGSLPVAGSAVAESTLGSDLYTLSGGSSQEIAVSGQIQHFVMSTGALSAMAGLPVAGTPTALALAVPQ